jgi:hypothetical protein
MKYIVDYGPMTDVRVFSSPPGVQHFPTRVYRVRGKVLEEFSKDCNEWFEVDPISGSAPIKVWHEVKK